MENVNQVNLDSPVVSSVAVPPAATNKSNSFLVMSLILLEVITILIVCFLYYQNNHLKSQILTVQYTPIPSTESNSQVVDTPLQQNVILPEGWSYIEGKECGVKFAIPPKEAPYYYPMDVNRQPSLTSEQGSGRFWDFPRGGTYPNLLSKLYTTKVNLEPKQAMAMFATSDEASGYVSQAVSVSCIKNDQLKIVDNEEMLSLLKGEIEKYNASTEEKGMQASAYKINSNTPAIKWGKNVMNLVVSEGATNVTYTMFVTPRYVYEIKVFGATSDSSVKDTAKKIFDNLVFE